MCVPLSAYWLFRHHSRSYQSKSHENRPAPGQKEEPIGQQKQIPMSMIYTIGISGLVRLSLWVWVSEMEWV